MAKATVHNPGVNLRKGKQSHLIVVSDADLFTDKTEVKNPVTDKKNAGVQFDGHVLKQGQAARRIHIRLKGNRDRKDNPPTTGDLSITLTDPSWASDVVVGSDATTTPSTNSVPVDYVDDDET